MLVSSLKLAVAAMRKNTKALATVILRSADTTRRLRAALEDEQSAHEEA